MGVERFELGTDFHVLVGTDVIRAPDFLTGSGVERRDPAAHSHLAATRPDDDSALYYDGRHRDRLPTREIAHLRSPDLSPGCGVDRNRMTVEQIVENFSVGVGGATIHHVTAGPSNRLLCIIGTEFPFQRLADLCQIDRVGDVRIRCHHVHRIADHQRLSFVTAQNAGRESPGYSQICRVLWCDR